ncbi:hypothetical protein [Solicola gregarius]|uniref:Uncharacterized protein n=1 Tax=Solicola gregarius TaxID=2908642 RepID=A0AA46TFZ6_9ACTN|nr:hypothetical protein [Solicola gregarius]UYM04159.1 hypothetical protein L0C25_16635 [Solicola gregarius]
MPFSGDWVRTHDERSAMLFLADRRLEAERRDARRRRRQRRFAELRFRVRLRFLRY